MMFSDVFNVIKFLSEKVANWNNLKREKIEKVYEEVVESSYHDLEAVHRDYSTQLSKLREHLMNKSLPPHELIQWLRQAGLEYRHKRESLQTIEAEIEGFKGEPINPDKDLKSKFHWYLQKYVKAVLDYFACTVSHNELSFYRDYENSLGDLLRAIEAEQQGKKDSAKIIARIFYEKDFVRDMHEELMRVCDVDLPKRWKEVNEQYRLLRAAVQNI